MACRLFRAIKLLFLFHLGKFFQKKVGFKGKKRRMADGEKRVVNAQYRTAPTHKTGGWKMNSTVISQRSSNLLFS